MLVGWVVCCWQEAKQWSIAKAASELRAKKLAEEQAKQEAQVSGWRRDVCY